MCNAKGCVVGLDHDDHFVDDDTTSNNRRILRALRAVGAQIEGTSRALAILCSLLVPRLERQARRAVRRNGRVSRYHSVHELVERSFDIVSTLACWSDPMKASLCAGGMAAGKLWIEIHSTDDELPEITLERACDAAVRKTLRELYEDHDWHAQPESCLGTGGDDGLSIDGLERVPLGGTTWITSRDPATVRFAQRLGLTHQADVSRFVSEVRCHFFSTVAKCDSEFHDFLVLDVLSFMPRRVSAEVVGIKEETTRTWYSRDSSSRPAPAVGKRARRPARKFVSLWPETVRSALDGGTMADWAHAFPILQLALMPNGNDLEVCERFAPRLVELFATPPERYRQWSRESVLKAASPGDVVGFARTVLLPSLKNYVQWACV